MNSVLVEFFRHHTWANLRVVDACAALTPDQLTATAPGTYGSIRETLLHLLETESRYLATLTDSTAPARRQPDAPFVGFETLREHARAQGDRLTAIAVHAHIDDMLRGEWQGQPYELSVAILLLAAINHGTEHRYEITSTLRFLDVEPPQIAAFAFAARDRQA